MAAHSNSIVFPAGSPSPLMVKAVPIKPFSGLTLRTLSGTGVGVGTDCGVTVFGGTTGNIAGAVGLDSFAHAAASPTKTINPSPMTGHRRTKSIGFDMNPLLSNQESMRALAGESGQGFRLRKTPESRELFNHFDR